MFATHLMSSERERLKLRARGLEAVQLDTLEVCVADVGGVEMRVTALPGVFLSLLERKHDALRNFVPVLELNPATHKWQARSPVFLRSERVLRSRSPLTPMPMRADQSTGLRSVRAAGQRERRRSSPIPPHRANHYRLAVGGTG